jgi:catechol 2,3-dioxygenase-like lactoylglutathione lyase family enzyme
MVQVTLKRTTLIVRDAERMMRFYRDVLGWRADYQSTMTLSGGIIPCGRPGDQVKLYIMEGADKEIAKIGLLEWTNPRLPETPVKTRLGIGDVVLVADVPDMNGLVKKIEAFPGARIHSPPKDGTFPDPRGAGVIEYSSMAFFDPEGFFYETYFRYNRPNPQQFLIRRTTCIVRDVERALGFFEHALGLPKIQDSTMQIEGMLAAGKAGDTVRFAVAKCQHDYIGMAAALQFIKDPLPDPGESTWTYCVGRALFVAGTDDAHGLFAKVQADGVKVTRAPFDRAVPKTGNAGETKLRSMGFHDPDGFVWEVNQRL